MTLRANLTSTYSIVARDPATGQLGIAVQTHQMSVGSRIMWLQAGLGAAITQSLTNVGYGPSALALLAQGVPPERVISALTASDDRPQVRQVAVVDAQGRAAAFTGIGCIREAGHHVGEGYSVQANMMTTPTVVQAMAAAFEAASGDLAQRMLAALQAAQAEGGDIRGMQSAALKVAPGEPSPRGWDWIYDLRVDEHDAPVTELARLVRLRHASLTDDAGYEALAKGRRAQALKLWKAARAEAPELEELAFWQAVALADEHDDVPAAATLLGPVLEHDPRRAHWLDLVGRLAACGIIAHADRAEALLAVLEGGTPPRRNTGRRSAKTAPVTESKDAPKTSKKARKTDKKADKGGKRKKSR